MLPEPFFRNLWPLIPSMRNMKSLLRACCVAALLVSTSFAPARAVRVWSHQELLDASDLAVIATPTASNDTKEQIALPGFVGQRVIGVETRFTVSGVLKGDKAIKDFGLHYYRPVPGAAIVANGPTFVHFTVSEKPSSPRRTYILFLHREADGRYAPVV